MKRWIFLALAIILILIGWFSARTWLRIRPAWLEPKFGEVTRGDIRVPITAAGLIEPRRRIDLKSEASGKVEQINVVEGDFVRAGDELVVLDPADEERAVARADAAKTQATSALAQANIAVEKANVQHQIAGERVKELTAARDLAELEHKEESDLADRGSTSEFRVKSLKARLDGAAAQLEQARFQVQNLLNDINQAKENVKIQTAALREAEKNYEEANDRLAETRIVAPSDGIITDVPVKVGTLVQSGKTGITGGTVVLTLADVTDLVVVTRVDEADYGRVAAVAPPDALPEMPPVEPAAEPPPVVNSADSAAGEVETAVPSNPGYALASDVSSESTTGQTNGSEQPDPLPSPEGTIRTASQPGQAEATEPSVPPTGRVRMTVDAFPEDEFEGMIERIEPQGRLNQGSSVIQFNVHVRVTDAKRYMLPLGTQAQVEFTVDHVNNALLVPAEAIKSFEGERGVWIRGTGAGRPGEAPPPKFVPCRLGISDGAVTQILDTLDGSELAVGTQVYTKLPSTNDDD